jgi:hypothetical protein
VGLAAFQTINLFVKLKISFEAVKACEELARVCFHDFLNSVQARIHGTKFGRQEVLQNLTEVIDHTHDVELYLSMLSGPAQIDRGREDNRAHI